MSSTLASSQTGKVVSMSEGLDAVTSAIAPSGGESPATAQRQKKRLLRRRPPTSRPVGDPSARTPRATRGSGATSSDTRARAMLWASPPGALFTGRAPPRRGPNQAHPFSEGRFSRTASSICIVDDEGYGSALSVEGDYDTARAGGPGHSFPRAKARSTRPRGRTETYQVRARESRRPERRLPPSDPPRGDASARRKPHHPPRRKRIIG